jgi:hypothetical protein
MGREFDASGNYLLNDNLVTNVGLGHFSPSTLMVKNVQGDPAHDSAIDRRCLKKRRGLTT